MIYYSINKELWKNWIEKNMPNHQDRVRKNNEPIEPKLTDLDKSDILRRAYQYLKHEDEFVKMLAQIAIYHYGD